MDLNSGTFYGSSMNQKGTQNPFFPNMMSGAPLQNAYLHNMMMHRKLAPTTNGFNSQPDQSEDPIKKLKIEDTGEADQTKISNENSSKTGEPQKTIKDPIRSDSTKNTTSYPLGLLNGGPESLQNMPPNPYLFPFPSQPPVFNMLNPNMGNFANMGLSQGMMGLPYPLAMMANPGVMSHMKLLTEGEDKNSVISKKNSLQSTKLSSSANIQAKVSHNIKKSEAKKAQDKRKVSDDEESLSIPPECCCKCHLNVENREDSSTPVNEKRKHDGTPEHHYEMHDDYRHIYSGRLRLKPGQKNYYKSIKKLARIEGGEQHEGSPFLVERIHRNVEYVSRETQTSPINSPHKASEAHKEIEILPKYQKRDYENYVMPLHITEENKNEIKLTSLGEAFQVPLPQLQGKKLKKTKKGRETKIVWNPQEVDEMNLWDYLGSLDQYIGVEVTNEEKAIKLFKKFKYSKNKVLESIRKNKGYYLNFLGIDAKAQRIDGE